MATIATVLITVLASVGAGTRVHPSTGTPTSIFSVSFVAPQDAGQSGIVSRSYSVSASTRAGRGCQSNVTATVPQARRGQRVRVGLRAGSPRRLCRGGYRGLVLEMTGPHCVRPHPCPAFATRQQTIGSFRFRVR
ncbi:MAG: hypothetical protein NVSMB25_21670 [Thermoleophilaceae bacterium]